MVRISWWLLLEEYVMNFAALWSVSQLGRASSPITRLLRLGLHSLHEVLVIPDDSTALG